MQTLALSGVIVGVLAWGCDRREDAGGRAALTVPEAPSAGSLSHAAAPLSAAVSASAGLAASSVPPPVQDFLMRWRFVEYEGGPETTIEVVLGRDRSMTCVKEEEEGASEREEHRGTAPQAAVDSFFCEMAAVQACHAGRKPSSAHVPGGPVAEEALELRGGGENCVMGLCPDVEPGSRCARIHAALNTLMLAGCKMGTGL